MKLLTAGFIVVVKKTFRYSNVFFYNRTRAYAAIPQLRNFEHYYEKRYNLSNNKSVEINNPRFLLLNLKEYISPPKIELVLKPYS
jgi:hypothetical protein